MEPPAGPRGIAQWSGGQGVRVRSPREAESLLALKHPKEGEILALLNDFSVVFSVQYRKNGPLPIGKPYLGAITMSLDIMISQKPGATQNLLPSTDRQYSL